MRVFDAELPEIGLQYLNRIAFSCKDYHACNHEIEDRCGCVDFFPSQEYVENIKKLSNDCSCDCVAESRAEYGDFQTNMDLADSIGQYLFEKGIDPEFVIEPTCGKGNFIIASLHVFHSVKSIIGIEIYEPYVWQCKFNILCHFLNCPTEKKPQIQIFHCNVFNFDFKKLNKKIDNGKLLILGNPPWVTNSMLGSLDSGNIPAKSNFKKQKGIDAITGKGNFDIAEYIVFSLLKTFDKVEGYLSLLLKNSVIKNVVYEQHNNRFCISSIKEMNIDSKKEFGVSVSASLLLCRLNKPASFQCEVSDFYGKTFISRYGWVEGSFLSKIEDDCFQKESVEGKCQLTWRQGVKHDCSKVMEFERENTYFVNKLNESFELEDDLVYGILKSSDLKNKIASHPQKYTIITQKFIGQDTGYISQYPKTHEYLLKHVDLFLNRKSSIYDGKPAFSIFGIGDYSFKLYKVAISGLYKTFHFTLVLPKDGKPIMLDDTCYFLGFDEIEEAVAICVLLNNENVQSFLRSIAFPDAKRMINKEVLMRIDLKKAYDSTNKDFLLEQANQMMKEFGKNQTIIKKEVFEYLLHQVEDKQLSLFDRINVLKNNKQ